ncbi:Carnosine N-methyltransferase [Abortiporus biennis]
MSTSTVVNQDVNVYVLLVACLIPLAVFFLGSQLFEKPFLSFQNIKDIIQGPTRILSNITPGHFSVERAAFSYETFLPFAMGEIRTMRASYQILGRAHKKIGYDLGYPAKLNKLEEVTVANGRIADGILGLAKEEFRDELNYNIGSMRGDVGRVRETLKHFVRDWSAEGKVEREVIFQPILDVLRQVPVESRPGMRVLVPGSGLGRLAWEISELGFETVAIELSYFMTLGLRFLLSPKTTERINQHKVHPYANWFSHTRANSNIFRSVSFPDVVPRRTDTLHFLEGDFLKHDPSHIFSNSGSYDFVVTLFFIDTSLNIISTLEHIHSILRPGGTWINLGPLLWTSGGQTRMELSLEEVFQLVERLGFVLDNGQTSSPSKTRQSTTDSSEVRQPRTIECEYTADRTAMMSWIYKAEFWVATKV